MMTMIDQQQQQPQQEQEPSLSVQGRYGRRRRDRPRQQHTRNGVCNTVALLMALLAAVAIVSPVTVMTVEWVDGFSPIMYPTPPPSPPSLASFHYHHHHQKLRSSALVYYVSSSLFLAATQNDDKESTRLDQAPGESDGDYIQRLKDHSAALMAESKIRITMDDVHQNMADEEQRKHDALETYKEYELMNNNNNSSSREEAAKKNDDDNREEEATTTTEHSTPPKQKTGGYQRVEDWDAEQKRKKANGELSWEERVQFDGLREGNQVKQNDILRKNLNMF